jgi:hypothetical protein
LRSVAPAQFGSLRAISHGRVVTASPVGESSFPALVVEQVPERVRAFDLSSPLPVLRTFTPANVRITANASWSHAVAIENYTDAELEFVSAYLMWVVQVPSTK